VVGPVTVTLRTDREALRKAVWMSPARSVGAITRARSQLQRRCRQLCRRIMRTARAAIARRSIRPFRRSHQDHRDTAEVVPLYIPTLRSSAEGRRSRYQPHESRRRPAMHCWIPSHARLRDERVPNAGELIRSLTPRWPVHFLVVSLTYSRQQFFKW